MSLFIVGLICSSLFGQRTIDHQVIEFDGKLALAISLDYIAVEMDTEIPTDFLSVYTGIHKKKDGISQPPVLGSVFYRDNKLIFLPTFSFRPKVIYTVFVDHQTPFQFSIKAHLQKTTNKVVAIYPTVDTLPLNQLKLYIHFSAPMQEAHIYDCIHLLSQAQDTVEKAFLALDPPLWDDSGERLTLWFDPGRVKRNLGPNQLLGPPLEENKMFRLVIDATCRDKKGNNLEASSSKTFFVHKADRSRPSLETWIIDAPRARSKKPLILFFQESLDHALIHETIRILDKDGQIVPGEFSDIPQEKGIAFTPSNPWKKGKYWLQVEGHLEDLAGNNLNRLFDRDLEEDEHLEKNTHSRVIKIR